MSHTVEIIVRQQLATEDRRLVYRPKCSCGWFGWVVWNRENAQRQADRHTNGVGNDECSARSGRTVSQREEERQWQALKGALRGEPGQGTVRGRVSN